MDTPIHVEKRSSVLEVTLNRPKANAIDVATSRQMGEVFAAFRDDPDLRVAVITGAGEKFFCPGWDLKAAADGEAVDSDYGVGGFGGLQELPDLNKPVVAAVNGICCGGGLERHGERVGRAGAAMTGARRSQETGGRRSRRASPTIIVC